MTPSDIARIRGEIDARHESAHHGLSGYAAVATHAAIEARMTRQAACLNEHLRDLIDQGKDDEARALLHSDQLWLSCELETR